MQVQTFLTYENAVKYFKYFAFFQSFSLRNCAYLLFTQKVLSIHVYLNDYLKSQHDDFELKWSGNYEWNFDVLLHAVAIRDFLNAKLGKHDINKGTYFETGEIIGDGLGLVINRTFEFRSLRCV